MESFWPLVECPTLENLNIDLREVVDNDHTPFLKMKNLKKLEFPINMFTTEQVAMLTANLPKVKSEVLAPYYFIEDYEEGRNVRIIGKGKPALNSKKNTKKIEEYKNQFEELVEQYKLSAKQL